MKYALYVAIFFLFGCGLGSAYGESSALELSEPETHLFVIYGQSNGAGGTRDVDTTPVLSGELWDVLNGNPAVLKDPTRYDGLHRGSAWPAFAEEYNRLSGNKAIILNASIGATAMHDMKVGTVNYNLLVEWLQDALAHYGNNIQSVSMIFVHGELDSSLQTPYDIYFKDLTEISDHLKSVTGKYTVTYVHRVGVNLSSIWASSLMKKFGHEIIERTKLREDLKPVFVKAPTFDFENGLQEPDFIHYSRAGYSMMGRKIAANIYNYQRGCDVAPNLYSESAYISEFGVVPPPSDPPCVAPPSPPNAAINVILLHYLQGR